jgi:transposase
MHVELYHPTSELKKIFRKEKDPRRAVRIRAVYLAVMGKTAPQIAHVLGYTRRVVQNWIYSYNRQGLDGLKDRTGRGTKSRLNADQLQWLRQRIDQGPTEGDGVCVFHAVDIERIIKQQFGVSYSVRQVQRFLRKLGYRYLSGRPEHPKGDAQARDTFKKTLLLRSETSVLYMLENE